YADAGGWPFGVLSDVHGICFSDEIVEPYDVRPAMLTDDRLWEVGRLVADRCGVRGITRVFYYYSSPVLTQPYQIMLAASGLDISSCQVLRPDPGRGSLLDYV